MAAAHFAAHFGPRATPSNRRSAGHAGGVSGIGVMETQDVQTNAETAVRSLDLTPMLTIPQVAEKCQVTVNTVREWQRNGVGPKWRKLGKHLRCEASDFVAWLNQSVVDAQPKVAHPADEYKGRWDD